MRPLELSSPEIDNRLNRGAGNCLRELFVLPIRRDSRSWFLTGDQHRNDEFMRQTRQCEESIHGFQRGARAEVPQSAHMQAANPANKSVFRMCRECQAKARTCGGRGLSVTALTQWLSLA